eukprot:9785229-Alexandrium_andersonii.AAC.1
MAVEISRQFGTSWSTVSADHPTVRRPLLPGVVVVECGTDGACGWNAVAVALQCLDKHVQPESLLPDAAGLGRGLRTAAQAHVVSGKFGDKHLKEWKPERTEAGKPATASQECGSSLWPGLASSLMASASRPWPASCSVALCSLTMPSQQPKCSIPAARASRPK